jgi:hypothetical protein
MHVSFNINCLFAYTFFYIVICLIGCTSLQLSRAPWKHVAKAIKKWDNKEIRSYFIKDLEVLFQKHTYGSEKFYLKLADLVIDNSSIS